MNTVEKMAKTVVALLLAVGVFVSNAKASCDRDTFVEDEACISCPIDKFVLDEQHNLTRCYPKCQNKTTPHCQQQEFYGVQIGTKFKLVCQVTTYPLSASILKGSEQVDKAEWNQMNFKPSLVLELLIGCEEMLKSFKCEAEYYENNATRELDQQFILKYEKLCRNELNTAVLNLTPPPTTKRSDAPCNGAAVSSVCLLVYVCTALLVFAVL